MANIIDAFLITLGLDTAGMETGAEKAKRTQEDIREEASKTAEHLQEQGQKAAEFFQNLLVGAGSALAAFTSLEKVREFTEDIAEADRETGRLSEMIGMSVEELSAWQGAVKLADGTSQGLNQSFKSMGGMLVDIEKNLPRAKRALVVFQAAGVKGLSLGKKTDILDVIDQLSDKMHSMGAMEALRLGQRMGLDEGTIRLFREGKDGIAKMKEEMGGLSHATAEDVKEANALEDSQKKLQQANEGIQRSIASVMRPAMIWVSEHLEKLVKFINEHKEGVRAAFIGIAAAMAVLGAVAAVVAIKVMIASWPLVLLVVLVGLLAAAVYYLYEEWKKWTEGGQSSLGRLFAALMDFWNKIKPAVMQTLAFLKQIFSAYFDVIIDQLTLFFAVLSGDPEKIKEAYKKLTDDLQKLFRLAFNYVLYQAALFVFTMINNFKMMWATMKQDATVMFDWLVSKWQNLNPVLRGALTAGMVLSGNGDVSSTLSAAAAVRPASVSSTTNAPSSSSVTIGEVNVVTQATDAKGVAGDIKHELHRTGLVGQADSGMGG